MACSGAPRPHASDDVLAFLPVARYLRLEPTAGAHWSVHIPFLRVKNGHAWAARRHRGGELNRILFLVLPHVLIYFLSPSTCNPIQTFLNAALGCHAFCILHHCTHESISRGNTDHVKLENTVFRLANLLIFFDDG